MNAEQFLQAQQNRRRVRPRPLNEAHDPQQQSALAKVLARAARRRREYEAVAAAWARVVPPASRDSAWVEEVRVDTALVLTESGSELGELRRQQATLERRVCALVPSLRHMRFELAGRPRSRPDVDRSDA